MQNNGLQEVPPELGLIDTLRRLTVTGNPMRRMARLLQLQDTMEKCRQYLLDKMPLERRCSVENAGRHNLLQHSA